MMLKHNTNFKSEGSSSYNFANRLRCASAHCEQAAFRKGSFRANRTRRSLDKSLYSKITGWSLAMLAVCGVFSYLTFIPNQAFAADDIVDPNEHRSLSQIDTMQEMSQQICINSHAEETKQLEDAREPGKTYWITKLKDGNCWMTQNLDYNGGGTATSISNWPSSGTAANYYDPGDYIYTYPGHGRAPDNNCDSVTSITASGCTNYFTTKNSSSDLHYHIGNYYSWPAAMNGVCPDNWQLPASDNTSTAFNALLMAYNWQNNKTQASDIGNKGIYDNPLYFVYSGELNGNRLRYGGRGGSYWSSDSYSNNTYALYLFISDTVSPAASPAPYNGLSVRCVAEGGWPTDRTSANVAIIVSPVISIDVTKHANDMTADFTKVATSTIVARVGSNQPYQVLLSTDKSDLTNPDTNQTIPMIPSDQTIVKGTSNWGIKKLSSPTDTTVNDDTIYSPVGINDNKALFYTSASAASEVLTFPIAIAVDSSLPSGQYSTQVTLTAVAM